MDGIVGQATWYKLVQLYVGVTRLAELVSEGQTYTYIQPPQVGVTLREGSVGTAVSALQYLLSVVGQFDDRIPVLTIDGVYGPGTRQAVIAAQQAFGLPADGIVGARTWLRIYEEYLGIANTALAGTDLPIGSQAIRDAVISKRFPGYDLTYGSAD